MLDKVGNSLHTKFDESFSHHKSHAAAGFYTSPFHNANILVVDAIGEWDTTSIWYGDQGSLKTYRTLKKDLFQKISLEFSGVTIFNSNTTSRFQTKRGRVYCYGYAAYGEPKHKTMLKRKLDSENLHWGLNIKFDGKPEDLPQCNQFTRMNYLNW